MRFHVGRVVVLAAVAISAACAPFRRSGPPDAVVFFKNDSPDQAKPLELLKEAVPTISQVAFLYDPATRPGPYGATSLMLLQQHASRQERVFCFKLGCLPWNPVCQCQDILFAHKIATSMAQNILQQDFDSEW